MNTTSILHKTVGGNAITSDEAYFFMKSVMNGDVSEILLASFLTSMKMRGETGDEILGFVKAMREFCIKPEEKFHFEYMDTCGTGGDGKNSLNISTLSALTLSSMGVRIAKHGNRSVSSLSGSSDLLQALGYNIHVSHGDAVKRLREKGFTFLFAPEWHPSMKYAAPVRKELGFRTVFNILGPMSNPFNPQHQILGVYSRELMEKMMHVLMSLGIHSAIVCHSRDGLDEFSVFAETEYLIYKNYELKEEIFRPDLLNLPSLHEIEFYCSSREDAIDLAKQVLAGKQITGTYAVALNTGAALYLLDKVTSIEEGFKDALTHLTTGKVKEYLEFLLN